MARKPRDPGLNSYVHVMNRGVQRSDIFREQQDRITFIRILEQSLDKFNCELIAYCLMTNHYHLLLKAGDVPFYNVLRHFQSRYAVHFNHKYEKTGHLFESRYVSRIIDSSSSLLEVSRYIHNNPVKAGMVRNPIDYPYSSYSAFVNSKVKSLANPTPILDLLGPGDNRLIYKHFVEMGQEDPDEIEMIALE